MQVNSEMILKINDKYDDDFILNKLQKHGKIGHFIYDYVNKVVRLDEQLLTMSELDTKIDILGMDEVRSLIHPDDWNMFKKTVAKGEMGIGAKTVFRILLSSGSVKWYETIINTDEFNGEPIIWGTVLDITLLKQAQNYQKKTLQSVEKYKQEQEVVINQMLENIDADVNNILHICDYIQSSVCVDDKLLNGLNSIREIVGKWLHVTDNDMLVDKERQSHTRYKRVLCICNSYEEQKQFLNDMTCNDTIELVTAETFDQVIMSVDEQKYDIILMDAYLKRASGLQLIPYIRSIGDDYKEIPIIVWAEQVHEEEKRSFFKAGADYFVQKQFLKVVFEKIVSDDIFYNEYSSSGNSSKLYKKIDIKSINAISMGMENKDLYKSCSDVSLRSKKYKELVKEAVDRRDKPLLAELFKEMSVDITTFGVMELSDSANMIGDALVDSDNVGVGLVIKDFLKEYEEFIEELDAFSNTLMI